MAGSAVVRHGFMGHSAAFRTGIGPLDGAPPRKSATGSTDMPAEKKVASPQASLPKWARRSKSLDALLAGALSARDSPPAISRKRCQPLLGVDAPNLSPWCHLPSDGRLAEQVNTSLAWP